MVPYISGPGAGEKTVVKSRICPRCGGRLFLDRDEDSEWYQYCLQCGYNRYLKPIAPLKLVHENSNKR